MILAEAFEVTLEVTAALDKLGVRYLVGGSFASSAYGEVRTTMDVDLLAELPGSVVDALVAELSDRFYIDKDMIMDAIRRRASFNLVHLATMFKVDVFVSGRSELLVEEMNRRQRLELGDPPRAVYVCSAEDIVVQKLDWYEKGSRISDRQWNDVLGVLKTRLQLDVDYMRRWAQHLGVEALLDRALAEAGRG